jgi:hypothetical protein
LGAKSRISQPPKYKASTADCIHILAFGCDGLIERPTLVAR